MGATKDARYRPGKFANWLSSMDRRWREPDLAGYRDELLETYAPATVSAHLSVIRAHYQQSSTTIQLRVREHPDMEGPTRVTRGDAPTNLEGCISVDRRGSWGHIR